MKKSEADRIIEKYVKSLYGFSMNKTGNISEAEELASRIILQVYDVLIKKDSFNDLNSYVFKIAHNVWTKYVHDKTTITNSLSIDNVALASDVDIDGYILQSEAAGRLRLEIAFLSRQQREIVILHYYRNLKVREIAEILGLPEGTVKWHLYESKKEMKKGMEVMRTVGYLGVKPIKFSSMGHHGKPGERGDTQDFIRKSITQNIAYAAYHGPLTINEIAEELGISPAFVEDEINELEEYGFMDRLPGGKYQTNILISEDSEEKWEALHSVYRTFADMVVEEYLLQFFDMEEQFRSLDIYVPNYDLNLLLWSVIPYAIGKLRFPQVEKISFDEVTTLRKDGGNYIALAFIRNDMKKSDAFNYNYCGDMYRGNKDIPILAWQLNTAWSNREMDWRDNISSDYLRLYHFIKGELPENYVNIDIYRRLIDKGYLIKAEDGYKVNIVYCGNKEITDKFNELLPAASDKLIKLGEKLDKAVYEIEKIGQPAHIHKIIKYRCQNSLTGLKTYILKNLIERGLLKEVSSEEAKGISTILFIGGKLNV